jgi:ATP-dependent HslUV protease subunit HslV
MFRAIINECWRRSSVLAPGTSVRSVLRGEKRHYGLNHGENNQMVATTILCVRKDNKVVMIGDGQVTFGTTRLKGNARKVRRVHNDKILVGMAGATADCFTLIELFEKELENANGQLLRASVSLAKQWRTDKMLRKLEAWLIVADDELSLALTGSGDVVEPEGNVIAVGSGGNFALSAARALIDVPGFDAEGVAKKAMNIAADLCIYTNRNFVIETIDLAKKELTKE